MSGWRNGLAALAAAALLAGCREEIAAPGRCPDLCPSGQLQLADTLLTGIVTSDSSFRGYATPIEGALIVLGNQDSLNAIGVLRMGPRGEFWFANTSDTLRIAAIDSLVLRFRILQRDTTVTGKRILVYRGPATIDSTFDYAQAAAYVAANVPIDSVAVDSVPGDTIRMRILNPAVLEPDSADSSVVGLIFVLHSDSPTVLTVASANFIGAGVRLDWYASASDTTKKHLFGTGPFFDTFVRTPAPVDVTATELFVGDLPSARAIMRFNLPASIVDSTTVIRATLLLTPTRPIGGRPGDRFTIEARGIIRDFGAKSFFTGEAALLGVAVLRQGDTAQVQVDMTQLLRTWKNVPPDSLPRTIMMRITEEGETLGGAAFARYNAGATAPQLRITYIRPFIFGVP